ncbi:thaumatin [Flagelloscypha sp. PMI_526]|nr:thaumatin [Flagelloscypha sp. PMI_526]
MVYNACPFTIWPAQFTGAKGNGVASYTNGWEAKAYTAVSFTVPAHWTAGRVWGRRNCNFSSGSSLPNTCLTGGCNGGLVCNPDTGTGVPPATVAEWTLGDAGGNDWYDISLVDGYNLPARINPSSDCHVASCGVDLGPNCPAELKGPYDSSGFPVGCASACQKGLWKGDPNNNPYCCTGIYSGGPGACPSSGIPYYSYFKSNCPNSYVYAYDEPSGTALWSCPSSKNSDYTVTFCPPP